LLAAHLLVQPNYGDNRFIEGFLKISKLMTELLEKDKEFEWTSACEASF
jgi:hypothetical protein